MIERCSVPGLPWPLFYPPDQQEAAHRLRDAIGSVWQRLPGPVRFLLLACWSACPPFIELADRLEAQPDKWTLGHYYARPDAPDWLAIAQPAVEKLSPEGLEALVAHELGHALLAMVAPGGHDEEELVNALVQKWGFDLEELRGIDGSGPPD
jgi:hypothetical protein